MNWIAGFLGQAVDGRPRSALSRYGVAILAVAVASLLRYPLNPLLEGAGFAIFFAAVVVAAWHGGLGPCLLAQVLSLAASMFFFSTPTEPPQPPARVITGIGAFFFVGIAAALLSDSLRAAQRRARAEADEAVSQREQLRTTLSCIGDAVIVADARGQATLMNPVAESLTGWTAADAQHQPLDRVFCVSHEPSREAAENPALRALREGRSVARDCLLMLSSRDGARRPIDFTAAPIRDNRGRITGVVLIFRDETERRHTEQALRDADRRKDEFLALLAHELRNPLAPIGNALQILKLAEHDPALRQESRIVMERQFEHLVRLVDDLLDVSRISRGKIELRPERTSLESVVQRAVEASRPLMDARKHTFQVDLPPKPMFLLADPVRLAQVITNLLTNAAKYTDPGGRVTLSARAEDSELLLSVRDTGIGIAPDALPRIFDMFMQVHAGPAHEQAGLGIGLSLVKSLTRMHGGDVEARSEGPGQGSEFLVRLPLVPIRKDQDETPDDPQGASAGKRRKILVVDDNVDAAESLARLLALKQHEVHVAHSGPDALRSVEGAQPDIVVLDIGMPGMDGYEVARRLRSRENGAAMIVVALTGWGGDEARRCTRQAGFDFHFAKPFKAHEIDFVTAQDLGAGLTPPPQGAYTHSDPGRSSAW